MCDVHSKAGVEYPRARSEYVSVSRARREALKMKDWKTDHATHSQQHQQQPERKTSAALTVPEGVLAASDGVHLARSSTGKVDERDDVAGTKPNAEGFSYPRQLPQLPQLSRCLAFRCT